MVDLEFLYLRSKIHVIQVAISTFLSTLWHSTSPVPFKQTPSIQYQYAACRRGRRRRREKKKKKRENKASTVVSPAGPGRAALAGASYVMWLAGPTSLFRAAAHTNPYWGTSPALEEGGDRGGAERGNQWRRCDYKTFSLSSLLNRTQRLFYELRFWKITVLNWHCWWLTIV